MNKTEEGEYMNQISTIIKVRELNINHSKGFTFPKEIAEMINLQVGTYCCNCCKKDNIWRAEIILEKIEEVQNGRNKI